MNNLGVFSLIYLIFLPFNVFFNQTPIHLLTSLTLGILLFILFQKPSLRTMLVFVMCLTLTMFLVKPHLGIDMGVINNINSQKGEHQNYQTSILAKVLHNKADLSYSFVGNIDKLLSPSAIFASGFWHNLSPYYSMGYLFPWDAYFIYLFFKNKKNNFISLINIFFIIPLLTLWFFTGLFYIDQATVFSFAIIYFLAFLSATEYQKTSKRAKIFLIILNLSFLLYHLLVTQYFKL